MADNTWRSNLRMPEADGETRVRFESSGSAFRVVVIESNGRIDYSPWTPYAENLTFTF